MQASRRRTCRSHAARVGTGLEGISSRPVRRIALLG
jgi:hypothetical protein